MFKETNDEQDVIFVDSMLNDIESSADKLQEAFSSIVINAVNSEVYKSKENLRRFILLLNLVEKKLKVIYRDSFIKDEIKNLRLIDKIKFLNVEEKKFLLNAYNSVKLPKTIQEISKSISNVEKENINI